MVFSQIMEMFKENKKATAWDLYKLLLVFKMRFSEGLAWIFINHVSLLSCVCVHTLVGYFC